MNDICGLCGEEGANKIPHPVYWPNELRPNTEFVHAECESDETNRAYSDLTSTQITAFLKSL